MFGCPVTGSIEIEDLLCNALQVDVSIKHESCYGETDGMLQITNIQNGATPYSILWSTGITGTVTDNLLGGTYQLDIMDRLGCPFKENYTINTATELSATTTVTIASSYSTNDGSIDLTVSGGTPPYTYYWSTATTTQDIGGLLPSVYWVSILDANNCQLLFNNIQVGTNCLSSIIQQDQPAIPSATFQVSDFIKSNGKVNVNEQVNFKAGDYICLLYTSPSPRDS